VLLGATGTGKTATVAWLAERLQRPVLVMQPNKTLAAQFANELRQFFPRMRSNTSSPTTTTTT
jgi:excinuclease ABC subunit B